MREREFRDAAVGKRGNITIRCYDNCLEREREDGFAAERREAFIGLREN